MLTRSPLIFFFFFFNDTATTEIYTLSLHDALPIYVWAAGARVRVFHLRLLELSERGHRRCRCATRGAAARARAARGRSEEHTSDLQSPCNLVCRLLLEKKKKFHTAFSPRLTHFCTI